MSEDQIDRRVRVIPTDDPVWLRAALEDALAEGAPVLPVPAADLENPEVRRLRELDPSELPDGTALIIRTSGSTGVPKSVALSAAALTASANATHEALGGAGQWLLALPLHLISGVQMLVRGILADTKPMLVPSGSFDPAMLIERAKKMTSERRYVSLVPVQLDRLLDYVSGHREALDVAQQFSAVLVGGQGVSLAQRQRAHELGIALRRSYGSSETAGGCVYDGVEIGDTRVRIRDGEVQIAGPQLALGYLGDPELTAQQFITDGGERWYRTGDSGSLLGGMLEVTGRLDRVIISGGVNVSLDVLERAITEIPGWEHAVTAAVNDPEWGQRPVVVIAAGPEVEPAAERVPFAEVEARIRKTLGAASVPDRVITVAALPRLGGGKIDRVKITQLVQSVEENQ